MRRHRRSSKFMGMKVGTLIVGAALGAAALYAYNKYFRTQPTMVVPVTPAATGFSMAIPPTAAPPWREYCTSGSRLYDVPPWQLKCSRYATMFNPSPVKTKNPVLWD